ncbi:DNA polymerase III subunit delta [Dehalococcoides mccartyi]|uniref:DNA polymerase III subunit delta n=1 Tax=Dehalococcoides mccartyi TaxID=61435 RepID=UPI002FC952D8
MLYIFTGSDDFSLKERLKQIKLALGDESLSSANTTMLEGKNLTAAELQNYVQTVPFLAPARLVIVNGLLERFEGSKGKAAAKDTADKNSPDEFARALSNLPPTTMAVLLDYTTAKDGDYREKEKVSALASNPLFKLISPGAEVKHFAPLSAQNLPGWVMQRAKQSSIQMSVPAARLLARFVGADLWALSSEIEKLGLYAQGRAVEEADVENMVGYSQEVNIFCLVDAVLDRKVKDAQQSLAAFTAGGGSPGFLLFMLVRQLRLMVRYTALKKRGLKETEIFKAMGGSEYALRKTASQAACQNMDSLKAIYSKLLETDFNIKTGRFEPELAMGLLVAELCGRK